ncbi:hypothetical protein PR048_030631 [Dryococelus australis]|uniref:DUF4219 domain-containing protein n=1 Tax=Dryococelus australis TaxID=614101 RepID=A0ABQ9G9G9_9NEOP|nr:hypothetical protein PR048_030631 [Dryococelus australis]
MRQYHVKTEFNQNPFPRRRRITVMATSTAGYPQASTVRALSVAPGGSPCPTRDPALHHQHSQVDKHLVRFCPLLSPLQHGVHVCNTNKQLAPGSGLLIVEKLIGRENFSTWKFAMKAYLVHNDLWEVIETL